MAIRVLAAVRIAKESENGTLSITVAARYSNPDSVIDLVLRRFALKPVFQISSRFAKGQSGMIAL